MHKKPKNWKKVIIFPNTFPLSLALHRYVFSAFLFNVILSAALRYVLGRCNNTYIYHFMMYGTMNLKCSGILTFIQLMCTFG
jgi:hypothetical protein